MARKIAEKQGDKQLRHTVVALRVRGGNVVTYGVNSLRYSQGLSYFFCSMHAEADLLRKSDFDLKGDKVFVYRFNNSCTRDPGDSKPCPLCATMLRGARAGKIHFMENGVPGVAKSENLPVINQDPVTLTQRVSKLANGSRFSLRVEQYVA